MSRIVNTYRALSGSEYVYYTSDEIPPNGITNISLVKSEIKPNELHSSSSLSSKGYNVVGLWQLNGDLTDDTGASDLAVSAGQEKYVPGPVKNSKAFSFNDVTYLNEAVSNSALHLSGTVTLMAAIKPYGLSSTGITPEHIVIMAGSGTDYLWSFSVVDENELRVEYYDGSGQTITPSPVVVLEPGRWNHVAYVREDNNTAKIFVNGIRYLSASVTLPNEAVSPSLYVGAFAGGTNPFLGSVSSLAVISGSLPDAEIAIQSKILIGE